MFLIKKLTAPAFSQFWMGRKGLIGWDEKGFMVWDEKGFLTRNVIRCQQMNNFVCFRKTETGN